MEEKLRFILEAEASAVEKGTKTAAQALQSYGNAVASFYGKVQNVASAAVSATKSASKSLQASAHTMQKQFDRLSFNQLVNEFNKISSEIQKQEAVVQSANEKYQEMADVLEEIRNAGLNIGDAQTTEIDTLAESANAAEDKLRALRIEQLRVIEAAAVKGESGAVFEDIQQKAASAKEEVAQTKLGLDSLAMGLQGLGSLGGSVGSTLTTLGYRVRTLKRGFTETAKTAGTMSAAIVTGVGAASLALTAIVGIVNAISNAQAEAARKAEETAQKAEEYKRAYSDTKTLVKEYENLSQKAKLSSDETARLNDIRAGLVEQYGFSIEAVDKEGRLLTGNLETMKEMLKTQAQMNLPELKTNTKNLLEEYKDLQLLLGMQKAIFDEGAVAITDDMIEKYNDRITEARGLATEYVTSMVDTLTAEFQAEGKDVSNAFYANVIKRIRDMILDEQIDSTEAQSYAQQMFESFFTIDEALPANSANNAVNLYLDNIKNAFIDADLDGSIVFEKLLEYMFPEGLDEAAYARAMELHDKIRAELATDEEQAEYEALAEAIDRALNGAVSSVHHYSSELEGITTADVMPIVNQIVKLRDGLTVSTEEIKKQNTEFAKLERQEARVKKSIGDVNKALDAYETGGKAATKQTKDFINEMDDIAKQKAAIEVLENTASSADDLKAAMGTLTDAGFDTTQITDDLDSVKTAVDQDEQAFISLINTIAASAGVVFNPDTGQFEVIEGKANSMQAAVIAALNTLQSANGAGLSMENGKIKAVVPNLKGLNSSRGGGGGGGSTNKALQNALDELEHLKALNQISYAEEIAWLERVYKAHAKTTAEKWELEEKIYALRNDMRRAELDYIEAMDQLTLREKEEFLRNEVSLYKEGTEARKSAERELYEVQKQLQRQEYDLKVYYGQLTLKEQEQIIKQMIAQYKVGTQQRIELEKELFDIQQQMRDMDIDRVNTVADGLLQALEQYYFEQQKAEEKRLRDSIDNWTEWGKAQTEAIQEQIKAIDELTSEEDKAEQERIKRRRIAALEQQLQYEQDEYNRRKLMQELEKAQEDLNKWLVQQEREALKAQLNDQIDAINETVAEKQAALEKELDATTEYYDELTKQQNLQAEAQRMILKGNQNEILAMLKNYASDYNLTGQTLGEQLVDGFQSAVGDIETWFDALAEKLTDYQAQLANAATAAADEFYRTHGTPASGTVKEGKTLSEQQAPSVIININHPVESPAEFGREMERLLIEIYDRS